MMAPWCFWQNDSVQIGFDPTLQRSHGYGEQGHEIGFALSDGEAIAHRWSGRRGQHLGVMDNVDIAIVRGGGETVYEAAIPLTELEPMAPDMWDRIGLCVTVNDSDDGLKRKARIELAPTAMTAGKQLGKFPVFEAAPSPDKRKLSAGLIWDRRCLSAGGRAELTVAVSSPETRKAKIRTTLESVDYPNTEPARSEMEIPVTAQPQEFTLSAATDSLPGRYYLTVEVVAPDGTAAAADTQPIYVYR